MAWVGIPALIFLARLCDVSLATLRHILIYRGIKKIAPLIGFFEALIWVVAITQIMKNLNNPVHFFTWALGFAAGTYLGILLEEKLALGHQLVRIITNRMSPELIEKLRGGGYGATVIPARGAVGPVDVIFVAAKRKDVPEVVQLIRQQDPRIFFTIEDVRSVDAGVFRGHKPLQRA